MSLAQLSGRLALPHRESHFQEVDLMKGTMTLQISQVMTKLSIRLRIKPIVFAITISALMLVLPVAHAQAIYGSIIGTVVDGSGAVVPSATVTLKDLSK